MPFILFFYVVFCEVHHTSGSVIVFPCCGVQCRFHFWPVYFFFSISFLSSANSCLILSVVSPSNFWALLHVICTSVSFWKSWRNTWSQLSTVCLFAFPGVIQRFHSSLSISVSSHVDLCWSLLDHPSSSGVNLFGSEGLCGSMPCRRFSRNLVRFVFTSPQPMGLGATGLFTRQRFSSSTSQRNCFLQTWCVCFLEQS